MDADERALLDTTVRDAIEGADGPESADTALSDLGWREMLHAEPRDSIDIVCTALGSTNVMATVLDDILASALGVEPSADLAVLLPQFAGWDPPGTVDGDQITLAGLASARVMTADSLLVVALAGDHLRLTRVPMGSVQTEVVRGIDPDAGLRVVRTDGIPRGDVKDAALDESTWDGAIAAGRRALAYQTAGATRAMLTLARTHAVERVQFDRPVARFQAVRHRLADALVAIETLDASVGASWDEPGPDTAALAKAIAGRTSRTVAAHCQQVLAGVGFTTEHPFHRYLKRTMALEGLFGSADAITRAIGQHLLQTRRVPTLIEL